MASMPFYDFTQWDLQQQQKLFQETCSPDHAQPAVSKKRKHKDARLFPRKPMVVPIHFIDRNTIEKATTANLSYSGVFISTPEHTPCQVKDRITMTFLSPSDHPFILAGTIVRKDRSGIGVRFLHK